MLTDQDPKEFAYSIIFTKKEFDEIEQRVEKFLKEVKVDENDYISFSEVCWKLMGQQSQYGSYYIDGIANHPRLGYGLEFVNGNEDYHNIKINKSDLKTFIKRYEKYKKGITSGRIYGL